jgi:hypothetical protein
MSSPFERKFRNTPSGCRDPFGFSRWRDAVARVDSARANLRNYTGGRYGLEGRLDAFQSPPKAWTKSTAAVIRWPRS